VAEITEVADDEIVQADRDTVFRPRAEPLESSWKVPTPVTRTS